MSRPAPKRDGSREDRYAAAALVDECEIVRNAPKGERNNTLNASALKLGSLVPRLAPEDIRRGLLDAARAAGLGESEAKATVESGMKAGMREPRDIPPPSHARSNGHGGPPPDEPGPQPPPAPRLGWREARDIFAPLPPTRWISRGLHLGPGRPAMLAAYGNSGKTIATQSLALSVAGGVPAWGRFEVVRGVVLHIDHEQGWHATAKRYQRLCRGLELEAAELDGWLRVSPMPELYLTDPSAADEYSRASEGVALVILDALRGATPGLDENDSRIRICIDTLTRVSERTGAAFWIIHHAGKPRDGHADARTVARGSSAIFDACGAVYNLSGSRGSAKLMSEQKVPAEAEGAPIEDFELVIEDVLVGTNPTAGVRVMARSLASQQAPAGPTPQVVERAERVMQILTTNPGVSKRFLRGEAGGKAQLTDDALGWLVGGGKVSQEKGPNGGHAYRLVGGVV